MLFFPSLVHFVQSSSESVDHVFVHCEVVNFLWKKLFMEAKMVWTTPSDRNDLFEENPSAFGRGEIARILWGCGVLVVVWVVWMERNR